MKSNGLVKFMLLAVVAALAAVLYLKRDVQGNGQASDALPGYGGDAIDDSTRAAIGIEGDTPSDTVRTLITGQREQRSALSALAAENESLQQANDKLLKMETNLRNRVDSDMRKEVSMLERRSSEAMDKMERMMSGWIEKQEAVSRQKEFDLKPTVASAPPATIYRHPGAVTDSEGTVWIPPIEAATQSAFNSAVKGGGPLADLLNLGSRKTGDKEDDGLLSLGSRDNKPKERPAYTIAKNSTLVGATAMTALVGRVPVGNNIVDPYSFKVIVGRENLIANGKTVPELGYAIVSGKAVGDWTLGCVSGKVYSITFVFEDGRIRTLPKPVDVGPGNEVTPDLKIGELSDDYGNPCVGGKKITNAGKYLAQRVLATTAQAAALAAAASQTTTTVDSFGGVAAGTTTVTGDKGQFIIDQSIAGAARETAQWIRDRQSLEFDAVYVRPGAKVAVHVTEELRIDYEDEGRLTHHDGFSLAAKHRELD